MKADRMDSAPLSRLSLIRNDVSAGIVVFLVALPLCLGIATASGVEPFAGLVSGIVGGLVVALLSGSHLSVSGPAAGLVVIVVSAIASLGSFSAFLAAVLIAGLLQVLFGLLKAGRLASLVPAAVIQGMLASIGIILIVKQLPLAVGLSTDATQALGAGTLWLHTPYGHVLPAAAALTVASLALLLAWDTPAVKRIAPLRAIPGPLAVVGLGIAATLLLRRFAPTLELPLEHRVMLEPLNSFAALGAAISLPDFSQLLELDVWRVALTLAVVASLETLLSLEAVEQMDKLRRRASPDRELKAQGVGNVVAATLGGLPLTSVIVRSSANVNAGARTRLSAVVHGVLLLASVFALTAVLNLIPLACLAAILLHIGFKLAHPRLFLAMLRQGARSALPFAATVGGVLATDLLAGIALGLAVGAVLALHANLRQTVTLTQRGDDFLLTFRKDASFLCKPLLMRKLDQIRDGAHVLIDAERADHIDLDVLDAVNRFIADAPLRNIAVHTRHWPGAHAAESPD
jgi:MFS superfamily sulfate permease-like transporter